MTETAQTIKDSLEVITPYLQSLADKLDTTASYLWAIQIKQAYIQGIVSLMIPLLFAVAAFTVYKIGLKIKQKEEYYETIILVTKAFLLFAFIDFVIDFKTILTCLLNPEYYALQQLINMFK